MSVADEPAVGGREAGEAAGEPGAGQREEREPPGARAAQAGEQREGQRRQQILRREREVRDAVVERAEAGVDEVRVRDGRQQERRSDARGLDRRSRSRERPPEKDDARRGDHGARRAQDPPPPRQRWSVPMPMPAAWSRPVATTKPML